MSFQHPPRLERGFGHCSPSRLCVCMFVCVCSVAEEKADADFFFFVQGEELILLGVAHTFIVPVSISHMAPIGLSPPTPMPPHQT